jgi:SAM-dependent methyltransferase
MKGLMDLGWTVYGVDYSSAGIQKHNPSVMPFVKIGDALENIEECIRKKIFFSMINLGNVLEHVPDPILLLKKIQKLLLSDGILRIVVPNDNSEIQDLLLHQSASNYEWVHPPDHLSYFNFENLRAILKYTGYKVFKMLGDFPIELFLTNKHSNYVKNKSKGKAAHNSRVLISNLIFKKGNNNYIKYSEGLAAAGIGRTCIAFSVKETPL